jgi:TPR repeat protein
MSTSALFRHAVGSGQVARAADRPIVHGRRGQLCEPFDDFRSLVARRLARLSALALILLLAASAIAPLRAQASVAQRPNDGEESASQLLDGSVRYTLRDYARAREILEPLAHQGNADAQQLVGSMFANGEGVPQDKARAAHWFSRAAEQGKVDAKFALGIMHRDGAGVPKDRTLALTWLRRAAEQQHCDAANSLGELYMESGSTADQQEAAAWFERAALMGNGTAQFNLGVLFALGKGVRQSQLQAYKWFALSARSSLDAQRDIAVRELLAMRERMMPSQVEAADLLMRDWVSRSQWARWGRWAN